MSAIVAINLGANGYTAMAGCRDYVCTSPYTYGRMHDVYVHEVAHYVYTHKHEGYVRVRSQPTSIHVHVCPRICMCVFTCVYYRLNRHAVHRMFGSSALIPH